MKIIRIILCTGFLISLVVIQFLIWQSENLTVQQKLVSSLFSWILPCMWMIIILSIEKTTKADLTIRQKSPFYKFTFALN
jgi:hypothetical protein